MLRFVNVHKSFGTKKVLRGINLEIKEGEFTAIIGSSGCGKTTLIRTVNGFVVPDQGEVFLDNEKVIYDNQLQLRRIRKKVGMIYQLFNLVERSTTFQNVLNGSLGEHNGIRGLLSLFGFFKKEKVEEALKYINYVGLEGSLYDRAEKLSGGQKQRVAIARALMQNPKLLLADEPIANLDPKTSHKILGLLKRINEETKLTTVVVIHHIDFVSSYFNRVIGIKNGVVVFDGDKSLLTKDLLDYIYSDHHDELYPVFEPDYKGVEECLIM